MFILKWVGIKIPNDDRQKQIKNQMEFLIKKTFLEAIENTHPKLRVQQSVTLDFYLIYMFSKLMNLNISEQQTCLKAFKEKEILFRFKILFNCFCYIPEIIQLQKLRHLSMFLRFSKEGRQIQNFGRALYELIDVITSETSLLDLDLEKNSPIKNEEQEIWQKNCQQKLNPVILFENKLQTLSDVPFSSPDIKKLDKDFNRIIKGCSSWFGKSQEKEPTHPQESESENENKANMFKKDINIQDSETNPITNQDFKIKSAEEFFRDTPPGLRKVLGLYPASPCKDLFKLLIMFVIFCLLVLRGKRMFLSFVGFLKKIFNKKFTH